jgi:hypothetical protein
MVEKQSGIAANPDTSQGAGCHDRCWACRVDNGPWGLVSARCSRLPDDEPFWKSVEFNFGLLQGFLRKERCCSLQKRAKEMPFRSFRPLPAWWPCEGNALHFTPCSEACEKKRWRWLLTTATALGAPPSMPGGGGFFLASISAAATARPAGSGWPGRPWRCRPVAGSGRARGWPFPWRSRRP